MRVPLPGQPPGHLLVCCALEVHFFGEQRSLPSLGGKEGMRVHSFAEFSHTDSMTSSCVTAPRLAGSGFAPESSLL